MRTTLPTQLRLFACHVALMLTLLECVAQAIEYVPVSVIDHSDDLRNFEFQDVYRDKRDFVWITTHGGLYRFDGKELRLYLTDLGGGPEKNHIHSKICEDDLTGLWFGTWSGIVNFNPVNESFRSYTVPHAITDARYFAIALEPDGDLWFAHNDSLYNFNINTEEVKAVAEFSVNMWNSEGVTDSKGEVSHIFSRNGYRSMPGTLVHSFDSGIYVGCDTVLAEEHGEHLAIFNTRQISDSTIWIITDRGVYTYDYKSKSPKTRRILTEIPGIRAASVMSDSTVMIGTEEGLYYEVRNDNQVVERKFNLSAGDEILTETPLDIVRDANGGLWILLIKRGIAFFHPGNMLLNYFPISLEYHDVIKQFDVNCMTELEDNSVLAGSEELGGIVLGCESGVFNGSIDRCGFCPEAVNPVHKDLGGNVWINSKGTQYVIINDERRRVVTPGLTWHSSVTLLPGGQMIRRSDHGELYLFDLDTSNNVKYEWIPLDTNYNYTSMDVDDSGTLYTAAIHRNTRQGYLFAFSSARTSEVLWTLPIEYNGCRVFAMEEEGKVILATSDGAYIANPDNGEVNRIGNSPDGIVWIALPLPGNRYLLAGDGGASIWDFKTGSCNKITTANGLINQSITWYGGLVHSSGKIWLGTNEGINIYDPERPVSLPEPGNINITSFRTVGKNNENRDLTAHIDSVEVIRLPFAQNTISVSFACLNYSGPESTTYEYRLIGLEDDWIMDNGGGMCRYFHLPQGKFTLAIRMAGIPETARYVNLEIIPPFYRRSWFLVLVSLAGILGVSAFVRGRQFRKRRRMQLSYEKRLAIQEERLRISNNLHDDLGSGISALSLHARVMAQDSANAGQRSALEEFANNAARLASQVSETIWTLNAENDTVDGLITHLHTYAVDYFKNTEIVCLSELPSEQSEREVDGLVRRQVLLAFKEILHNVIKHAGAEVVIIVFVIEEQKMSVSITDDGSGFDASHTYDKSHSGLKSIRQRMARVNGVASIESRPGRTVVKLTFPVGEESPI